MVRIERNVSIVDYVSVDDELVGEAMRDYVTDMETCNGQHFQFDGFIENLAEAAIHGSDDEASHRLIAVEEFMRAHNLIDSDYFYFWW